MLPELNDLIRDMKYRREKLGWSQARLARESRVSQSLLNKMERGVIIPSYNKIQRIDYALSREKKIPSSIIGEFMSPIVSVSIDDNVEKAASIMKQNNYSQLPVKRGKEYVGTVSSIGLVGAPYEEPIFGYVERPFRIVRYDVRLGVGRDMFRRERLIAVLVRRTDSEEIAGIVTAHDLI
jgi:predicted transcriptional regulator